MGFKQVSISSEVPNPIGIKVSYISWGDSQYCHVPPLQGLLFSVDWGHVEGLYKWSCSLFTCMVPSNYNGTIHVRLDLTHTAEPDSFGCVQLESGPAAASDSSRTSLPQISPYENGINEMRMSFIMFMQPTRSPGVPESQQPVFFILFNPVLVSIIPE